MSWESMNIITQSYCDKAFDTFVRGLKGDLPGLLSIRDPADLPQAPHSIMRKACHSIPPLVPLRRSIQSFIKPSTIPASRRAFYPVLLHNPQVSQQPRTGATILTPPSSKFPPVPASTAATGSSTNGSGTGPRANIEITHDAFVQLFGPTADKIQFFILPNLISFDGIIGNDTLTTSLKDIIHTDESYLTFYLNLYIPLKQCISETVNNVDIRTSHLNEH